MDKTEDLITPGGRPVILENPHSTEFGPMDSGGDQLLLRRSLLTSRTPPKTTQVHQTTRTSTGDQVNKNGNKTTVNNNTTETTQILNENGKDSHILYQKWQEEIAARKQLEQLVNRLQQHIQELECKVANMARDKVIVPDKTIGPDDRSDFLTDEEELARETDWILKKSRRSVKKRKAEGSPEIYAETNKQHSSVKVAAKETQCANVAGKQHSSVNIATKEKQIFFENNIEKAKKKKEYAPPPIIISGIATFGEIKSLTQPTSGNNCKYTSFNNNIWKVNVADSATYRSTTTELTKQKVQWHTYENKDSRPIKVMARGLHPSCDENEIIQDLVDKGMQILEAKNILKKEKISRDNGEETITKRGLPLFMLTFHDKESTEKIYNIKSIMGLVVKIEPLRKSSNLIPQCKRCQTYGHTQRYCNRDFVCVKCAGKHPTNACALKREEKPKCANCRGDHPASYRGCLIAKEQQLRKNKKAGPRPNNQKEVEKTKPTAQSSKSENPRSYAQIVKNTRKEEEISTKEMLTLILKRMNDQDKRIKIFGEDLVEMKKNICKPQLLERK